MALVAREQYSLARRTRQSEENMDDILEEEKADRWVAVMAEFSRLVGDHLGSRGLLVSRDGLYAVSSNSLLLLSQENVILACFRTSDSDSIRWRANWLPAEEMVVFQDLKWPSSCGILVVIARQNGKAATGGVCQRAPTT